MTINWVLITVALAFMALDVISGLCKAWYLHDMQSQALRRGLFHKIGFMGAIVLAGLFEWAAMVTPQITLAVPLMTCVCVYVILTECVSILENLKAINPTIAGIANRFPQHQEEADLIVEDTSTASNPPADPDPPHEDTE